MKCPELVSSNNAHSILKEILLVLAFLLGFCGTYNQ